jgi:hypothetical protein
VTLEGLSPTTQAAAGTATAGSGAAPAATLRVVARDRATRAFDLVGREAAADIVDRLVQAARGGDLQAIGLLLPRIWPARRGAPVAVDLPPVRDAASLADGTAAILAAVADGVLSCEEGEALARVLDMHRAAVETGALAERVALLEQRLGRQ